MAERHEARVEYFNRLNEAEESMCLRIFFLPVWIIGIFAVIVFTAGLLILLHVSDNILGILLTISGLVLFAVAIYYAISRIAECDGCLGYFRGRRSARNPTSPSQTEADSEQHVQSPDVPTAPLRPRFTHALPPNMYPSTPTTVDSVQSPSLPDSPEMAETEPHTSGTSIASLPTPQTESVPGVPSDPAWGLAQTMPQQIATRTNEGETSRQTREVSRCINDTGNPTSSVSECQADETKSIDG